MTDTRECPECGGTGEQEDVNDYTSTVECWICKDSIADQLRKASMADVVSIDLAHDAAAHIEKLERWKAEALTVLAEWENVWEQAGRPGPLGASKALSVGHELERRK